LRHQGLKTAKSDQLESPIRSYLGNVRRELSETCRANSLEEIRVFDGIVP